MEESIMEKSVINKFFENVKHITEQKREQRVNVLYLTTACNLKCTYCYEQDSRDEKPKKLTRVHIDQFLHEIKNREGGMVSTVVIMGGEPMLEYDLLCYALEEMANSVHDWGVTITTNGTIGREYNALMKWQDYDNISLTLEVSYDVTGQDARVYKTERNGTRDVVEGFLNKLMTEDIPFAISYTIHKGNYKNILADMVLLCEKYKPTKISLSPYCQELDDVMGDYKQFMKYFKPYAEYITQKYGIPICDLACNVCGKCDKSTFVGNAYMSPTTGLTYQAQSTKKKFDKF